MNPASLKTTVEEEINEVALVRVGRGLYAIPVVVVREFLEAQDFVEIPKSPPDVLGLIDLRGEHISVVDLGVRLGLSNLVTHESSRVVILDMDNERPPCGILTDGVVDVAVIESDQDLDFPGSEGSTAREYVTKVGRYRDQAVLLLDMEKLFSG